MIATFGFHQIAIFKGLKRSFLMSKPDNYLTAQQFARKAGVSAATVSKWLRDGTILGKKISGKWSISSDELAKVAQSGKTTKTPSRQPAPDPKPQAPKTTAGAKSYSIREFSDISYLTEYGVQKWLKEGRLKKVVDAEGQLRVDGSSLEDPNVKRLLR
jgi:transcriptional regulator with XRE-family HTH domain